MELHLGDCLEKLKELADNSVDAIVTDPPYGLSFMGKKWDYDVPSKELWIEVIRVLKPGGHLLSFGGTRTYHRMVVAIEEAGFEIRDQIQWIYGSGFPKSHNLGDGRGTALKPANEPIVLARKPLSEKTVAKNVEKWGCGALNIDAGRIAGEKRSPEFKDPKSELGYHGGSANSNLIGWDKSQGRWPANVLFDEEAAEMLDEQSGTLKSGGNTQFPGRGTFPIETQKRMHYKEQGGASRFFYVAKASKRERGQDNSHPTVKPLKLMEYLIKLITPPGGCVLDPFMGSGSTGVAAKRLGFKFIGIEMNEEYLEIARKRIGTG